MQILATDVDEAAIAFARQSVYPAAALAGVSPQRQTRYFRKLDGNFQVTEKIRGLVVFGLHDLGVGAPFPRIDLVLCRNVLMYLTRDLQTRALQAFAFSLRIGGYLVLGTAESISPDAEHFTPASRSLKLYCRVGERVFNPMPTAESTQSLAMSGMPPRPGARLPSFGAFARATASERAAAALGGKQQQLSAQELELRETRSTQERLGLAVLGLPVGVVLVDRHNDVQIINETAMRLLDIYTEPIGQDLIHLARTIPSTALQQAIDAALRRELWPLWPLRPLVPLQQEQQQLPTSTTSTPSTTLGEPFATLEGVVTVETLLGERRSLQFTCYPFVGSPPAAHATPATPTTPATHDLAAHQHIPNVPEGAIATEATAPERSTGEAQASSNVGAHAQTPPPPPQQAGSVLLVLVLIRDVTDVVRQFEERARASAYRHEVSTAEQAHARGELETMAERLQSEVARLSEASARQSDINRSLLEGNQQLAATNLTLRTANEQLQLSAQEAEASTEEVKTLNEELQASNEELVTLNEELEATLEELHASNDELQARTRTLQDLAAKAEVKGHRAARQVPKAKTKAEAEAKGHDESA